MFWLAINVIPKFIGKKYSSELLLAIILFFTIFHFFNPSPFETSERMLRGFGYGLVVIVFGIFVAFSKEKSEKKKLQNDPYRKK
jgi:hypothetical protein